jgi:hypothetical protein
MLRGKNLNTPNPQQHISFPPNFVAILPILPIKAPIPRKQRHHLSLLDKMTYFAAFRH